MALFRRLEPGLELTPAGRRYLETVNRRAGALREAQDALAPDARVRCASARSSRSARSWLVPRLGSFERAHPGIELEVEATLRYADFERDPVDVAIRFGTGPWAGLHSEPIVDLTYFPVSQPGARRRRSAAPPSPPISRAHADPRDPDAGRVARLAARTRAAGPPAARARSPTTTSASRSSAAEAGQGVALATHVARARATCAEGRLCAPFAARALRRRPITSCVGRRASTTRASRRSATGCGVAERRLRPIREPRRASGRGCDCAPRNRACKEIVCAARAPRR